MDAKQNVVVEYCIKFSALSPVSFHFWMPSDLFVFLVVTIPCSHFLYREKKKEKEREELWKQLEKLEIETRNKSTTSVSNPAGSSPNPSTSTGAGTATKNVKS